MLCSNSVEAEPKATPAVATVCAPCHGLDGIGHDVEVPNIAGQHSVYLREQLLAFKVADENTQRCTSSGGTRLIEELMSLWSTIRSWRSLMLRIKSKLNRRVLSNSDKRRTDDSPPDPHPSGR